MCFNFNLFTEKTQLSLVVANLSRNLHCRHCRHRDSFHTNQGRKIWITFVFEKLFFESFNNDFHHNLFSFFTSLNIFLVKYNFALQLSQENQSQESQRRSCAKYN